MNENVRKVFDMLGVEPLEKFKIEGNGETKYYIDERMYVFRDNGIFCSDKALSNLLNGYFKIIKLPKKKKLRDITEEEFEKWEVKNCRILSGTCNNCLFKLVYCAINTERCWVLNKKLYSDEFLDQEIEVLEE